MIKHMEASFHVFCRLRIGELERNNRPGLSVETPAQLKQLFDVFPHKGGGYNQTEEHQPRRCCRLAENTELFDHFKFCRIR